MLSVKFLLTEILSLHDMTADELSLFSVSDVGLIYEMEGHLVLEAAIQFTALHSVFVKFCRAKKRGFNAYLRMLFPTSGCCLKSTNVTPHWTPEHIP